MAQAVDIARSQLLNAGFAYVRAEAVARSKGGRRQSVVDLVAWGANEDGELRPYAAIEIKAKADPASVEAALAQLAFVRDSLGTQAHFVFAGGQWFEADAGLCQANSITGPPPPPPVDGVTS